MAQEQAAAPHPGVQGYRLIAQFRRQPAGYMGGGIIILAENDAAMLQPVFSVRSELRQEPPDCLQFFIPDAFLLQQAAHCFQAGFFRRGKIA